MDADFCASVPPSHNKPLMTKFQKTNDPSINQQHTSTDDKSSLLTKSLHPTPHSSSSLSLMELVHGITNVFTECSLNKTSLELSSLESLLSQYTGSDGEWKRFAFWDDKKKYTRNLIATDQQNFTLMLLCWNPLIASPVHNHSGSECFMKVLEGMIIETRYKDESVVVSTPSSADSTDVQPSSPRCCLHIVGRRCVNAGEIVFINDNLGLHKVDSMNSRAVTLHLYIPPYEQCKCYEEETGKHKLGFVTFYSENGELLEAHAEE